MCFSVGLAVGWTSLHPYDSFEIFLRNKHERCRLPRIETSAESRGIRLQMNHQNSSNLYIANRQPFL